MKLGYELTIEQTQKLSMTPELIQAIQILQFSNQELTDYVQNELLENPVLEAEKTYEAQEVDIEIKPEDIEITVCRASGPGGQGVNTTDSAVQINHKPSGMIVRCADQRSQQQNRLQAMTILRSRLLEKKIAEENAKYSAQRKAQVGTGERNERIRTYNFPQSRVSDHRIELTLYNIDAVMEGDLDCFIEPLIAADIEERLQELEKE